MCTKYNSSYMYRLHCYVPIQAHRANTPQDAEMVLITIWAANTVTALLSVTASASETSAKPLSYSNQMYLCFTSGAL